MNFDIASGAGDVQSKKRKGSRKSVYDRQREEDTIQNAINRGYLRRMTVEFLNESVGLDDSELPTTGYLNISSQQLSSLGVLKLCISLRICILSENYITEFDALASCSNLWVLDLHSNQIKRVPDHAFWSSLKHLQIVFLHDNGISKLETVHHLSSSPSLLILTLYDTPLSLKKNYRHHVVNGVWSLKALDFHVISDEEIIEDAKMEGKFGALQKSFKIDLSHTLTKESSLEEAVAQMDELKGKVNDIQAKFCPVLIIQKGFRMYMVRRRYKLLMATRVWAATTIQRFYRFHKELAIVRKAVIPPQTSPTPPRCCSTVDDVGSRERKESQVEDGKGKENGSDSREARKTDVSEHISRESLFGSYEALDSALDFGNKSGEVVRGSSGSPGGDLARKVSRRLTIDLVKLESSTMDALQSSARPTVNDSGLKDKVLKDVDSKAGPRERGRSEVIILEKRRKTELVDRPFTERRLKPEMVGKYHTVRVFLGPILTSKAKENDDSNGDEDETTGFRLNGIEPPKQRNAPIVEMVLARKEKAEEVRQSLRQYHWKLPRKFSQKKVEDTTLTNDQKLFLRTHGTMGLACLRAVHQAYGDRRKAQMQADLASRVTDMKERRELGLERLHQLKQEDQNYILQERIQDGVKTEDLLRENEIKQNDQHRKLLERRMAAAREDRMRQSDLAFAREFVCQQNLVSQALKNHDRAEMKREKVTRLAETVRRERESSLEKQALVRKYMEHRSLLSQAEVSKTKAEMKARLLENANKVFVETQANMKRMKMRKVKGKESYPLARLLVPKIDTPQIVVSQAKSNKCGNEDLGPEG